MHSVFWTPCLRGGTQPEVVLSPDAQPLGQCRRPPQKDSSPPIHPHPALYHLSVLSFSLEINSFCLYPSLPTRLGEKAHPTKLLTKAPGLLPACMKEGNGDGRLRKETPKPSNQTNQTTTTKTHTYFAEFDLGFDTKQFSAGGSGMCLTLGKLQTSGVSFPVGMLLGAS